MYKQVIDFWFHELEPKQWWQKDIAFDELIESRFAELHNRASIGELSAWRETALGSLAEVIVLDQFSRNIYRDKPESFASDSLALDLAQLAISKGQDKDLNQQQRSFLYMPYMHSESPKIHEKTLQLFEDLGMSNTLEFEHKHKAIIDRFGRYPHRNLILGRSSTAEELEFLRQPGSGF